MESVSLKKRGRGPLGYKVYLLVSLLAACFLLVLMLTSGTAMTQIPTLLLATPLPTNQKCDDIISKMMIGRWEQHAMTDKEKAKMDNFYQEVLKSRGVGHGIQRADGSCGAIFNTWYRALCHPWGPTPCCLHHRCVNRDQGQCACPNCYDLRTQIEPEYASWHPQNPECSGHTLSGRETCQLLDGATVIFIGDSLIRHLYVAFLMLTAGNPGAAQAKNIPSGLKERCEELAMFTINECRAYVNYDPVVCGGKVTVRFLLLRSVKVAATIHRHVAQQIKTNNSRTLIVLGIGIDDRFDAPKIQKFIWNPILAMLSSTSRAAIFNRKLLWASPMAPGILKAAKWNQDYGHVKLFTEEMNAFMRAKGVPVLDSFTNLTQGVMSHDGTHYGWGVNRVRAQALLSHVLQLWTAGQW